MLVVSDATPIILLAKLSDMEFYKKCSKKYTSQSFKEIKDVFKCVKARL